MRGSTGTGAADEAEYVSSRQHVRQQLARIRRKIERGDDSELFVWGEPGRLAGSHRPLRYHPTYGGRGSLPPDARDAVEVWVDRVIGEGIRTVFCLATEGEVRRYDDLELHPDGFLAYLQERGLTVRHLPLADPAHLPPGEGKGWKETKLPLVQRDAAAMYQDATKPVLVFCSGGADRTPPVVAYLVTAHPG